MTAKPDKSTPVPGGQLFFARLMRRTGGLWERLGNLETRVLGGEIADVEIRGPIYVTSLARAGTTIITEMLARHPDVTSHRYSDFPPVWTPYWWNALRSKLPLPEVPAAERAHRDRLEVTPDSPEAVEEVLWMRFFPGAHDDSVSNVLDGDTDNPDFERFYRDHVRKLLAVRGAKRYLAKGNYNLARLEYLLKLFPDARFVIPVRDPVWHIASLMKQDRLFNAQHDANPKAKDYMHLLGHFEFGSGKHCINLGDPKIVGEIRRLWESDEAVKGWALYWRSLYEHLLARMDDNERLADAILLVGYEALCREPAETIDRILAHVELDAGVFGDVRAEFIERLSPPDYYRPDFSDAELATIREITSDTARRLGVPVSA